MKSFLRRSNYAKLLIQKHRNGSTGEVQLTFQKNLAKFDNYNSLEKMYEYTITGQDFYSLAEGSQDHYLSLMIDEAVKTGEKIKTEQQPWASK